MTTLIMVKRIKAITIGFLFFIILAAISIIVHPSLPKQKIHYNIIKDTMSVSQQTVL